MVYALYKFCHYLLGGHFNFFIDHSTMKYLVNKLVLEGQIFRWLLLLQEFAFEVVVKPRQLNKGPSHLSLLEYGEFEGPDDQLHDVDLLRVEVVPDHLAEISLFLSTSFALDHYSAT